VVNLVVILLSMTLQIAAAGFAFRVNRREGRPGAWLLISAALVLMAARRLYGLVELIQRGLPSGLLWNELAGLAVSACMLAGVLLIQDIFRTKARHAERLEATRAEARGEADQLSAVLAATPVPTWITEDPLGRGARGNPAAAALLRLPAVGGASPSADPWDAASPVRLLREGRPLAPEDTPLVRAARQGEEVRDLAMDLVFPDGETRHLSVYATPLRDRAGRVHGAVCCVVDVTEIRHAEEALAKAQKLESLGMLAGGLAHDFNNIFQAMVANLDMARSALPGDARAQAYLQRLQSGLDRASRLSRDILHCSGGDLRRPESVDLGPLVAEALEGAGLPVARDLPGQLPKVMVDPVLVGRVVEGLVTNALEAGSPAASIQVRVSVRIVTAGDLAMGLWPEPVAPGSYVVLEVSDQGHGIDAATLPRIFDPFFSTRDLGRGLGLAATLGIVRGHHGGVQVESTPGVGSVFRVHLPAPEGPEAPRPVALDGPRRHHLVLLADDEAELRSVMAEMLEDWFDLEVVTASDGQEALEIFQQRPEAFDLVILDATMPRMGGVAAFAAMRERRPGLPGILCSGYALPASREQASTQGFTDFLKKPFSSAELERLLKRVLGVRKG
jgi:signal transduction histidine kinase/ActR/RegA family two-component response regulator